MVRGSHVAVANASATSASGIAVAHSLMEYEDAAVALARRAHTWLRETRRIRVGHVAAVAAAHGPQLASAVVAAAAAASEVADCGCAGAVHERRGDGGLGWGGVIVA